MIHVLEESPEARDVEKGEKTGARRFRGTKEREGTKRLSAIHLSPDGRKNHNCDKK